MHASAMYKGCDASHIVCMQLLHCRQAAMQARHSKTCVTVHAVAIEEAEKDGKKGC